MRRIYVIAAVLVVGLVFAGCGGKKKDVDKEQATDESVLIKTAVATSEAVAQTIDFTASLQPDKQNFVVPAMAGRIERILVDVGDRVKKGQLLVEMDRTQYNQYAVQLSNAEMNLSRMQSVYEAGGVSKQQIDEITTNITVLKETVANLKRNIELRSPIDGLITGRFNEAGDLFTMSPNAAGGVGILQVMQMNPMKATVAIPEAYFLDVTVGMKVSVVAELFSDREFTGSVRRIAPSISASTRTFDVEISIPNTQLVLRAGMYARTAFNMGNRQSITIEDVAVRKQSGTNARYVFVINDGIAEQRMVTIGRQTGSRIEILNGLNEGEVVAVAGLARLADGKKVSITN